MATAAPHASVTHTEARFFFIMACLMAATTIGGFALMAAMGISSFSLPAIYHIHAGVFIAWTALYVAQNSLIWRGNTATHRKLGKSAAVLIPVMVVLAITITFMTLRITGGPPFFAQAEFLAVNLFHITAFAVLAGWALKRRRETDWHRRLMFGAMATVGAPGLARLLPLPLTIPYTFYVVFGAALVFPLIGMIADKRMHGEVHRAWWWTILVPVAALLIGEVLGNTAFVQGWVAEWVAGTPGGERPAGPFIPPGF
ncbi:hypothetical protein [Erythrobacter sp. THAF29]|uniref:hypothetical protein n=1 Tax=Erythrobacter sp. THAF29 TaxID=2587851 RepID=UPI001267EC3D|nr:hypothetical protein [Erythrobacter sp. THAF29]QFT76889.1 hypothetical protein FIU90_04985 [Erythrobacter sp. THAF29]